MELHPFGRRQLALGGLAALAVARRSERVPPGCTTTTVAPSTTVAPTIPPVAPNLAATLGAYPGYGGAGCRQMLTIYEPFLGRPFRYAAQNFDYRPTAMTSSAWGLVNESGAWQTVGLDDPRHVRLAVTVPLRLAADGNRNGITSAVAATIRQGLIATASGALDSKFLTCANHLRSGGHGDAILRIGHEPDISWYPWSMLGGNADVYKTAFRRCRQVFKSVSSSFQVDYNTDSDALLSYPGFANRLSAGYPGDEYVDIVGIDIYNRAPWATNLNKLNAVATFATAHGKLLSVPEWGLWKNETGDDATFVQNMRDWFVTQPRLLYQGYFWHHPNASLDPTTISGVSYAAPNAKARYRALFG